MTLQLDGVDLVRLREHRDDRAHRRDVHVGAVQHDDRVAGAGDFVVHLHAVHRDAFPRRLGRTDGGSAEQQGSGDEDRAEHGSAPFEIA